MHANIPAIEIAFGDTFREASHIVADCAHFLFRVAIGRRSIPFAADSFIARAIHSRVKAQWPDHNLGERRAFHRDTNTLALAHHAFLRDDAETCL